MFGLRSSRLGHKSKGKLTVRTEKTRLVRGIYHLVFWSPKSYMKSAICVENTVDSAMTVLSLGPSKERNINMAFFTNKVFILCWFSSSVAKGSGKRGHIVADTNVFPFARTRNICCGHKFCVRDTKSVSDFVQKHFVSATNVSQFARPKKHHGQQCVLVYQGLKTWWSLFNQWAKL